METKPLSQLFGRGGISRGRIQPLQVPSIQQHQPYRARDPLFAPWTGHQPTTTLGLKAIGNEISWEHPITPDTVNDEIIIRNNKIKELESKITEKQNVFPGVWQRGFYILSSIRGGATPMDLLKLEPVYWHRLSEAAWVIDRMRIVQLVYSPRGEAVLVPRGLLNLWNELFSAAADLDWRNGWRYSLE